MSNPLLTFWFRIFGDGERPVVPEHDRDDGSSGRELVLPTESAPILLVLRRMRAPLIVLIVIFAISVLGLTVIPGRDVQGHPVRMGFLDAFYVMSFTATTIGFGEIPHPFTPAQRMWVTVAIFLSVIGWAYAVGSLLALMQDRSFRQVLARRHVTRKVARLAEPFVLLIGYGNATKRVARSLDDMGRRLVVIERDESRVAAVDLDSYRADTPALLGDARDTDRLALAGLGQRRCEGVVALAGDDEVNLDVAMTTALLRPDLPVIARANSRQVAERMRAFGAPEVVNPFDRFGDHLRILLRSPASYQLMVWLTSAPGTTLPPRPAPFPPGPWVVCGDPDLVHELAADLRAERLEVVTVERAAAAVVEERSDSGGVPAAHLRGAAVFVAATRSDTANLWLVETARRANRHLALVAMQNHRVNAALFEAAGVGFGLVPDEVVAHEVLARLANPLLMSFLPLVPRQDDVWAVDLVARLVQACGTGTPDLWRVRLTADEAPALTSYLTARELTLGDLMRSPADREHPLDAVPLLLMRHGSRLLTPGNDAVLEADDELLIAAGVPARRALDATLAHEPTAAYVVDGRFIPSSWVWRRFARREPGRTYQDA